MNTGRCYISGKISGLVDLGETKFDTMENWLRLMYGTDADIVNPHKLPCNHDKRWESYMKVCIDELVRCQLVLAMDCWKKSRGASIEVLLASVLGITLCKMERGELVEFQLSTWDKIKIGFKILLNRF